MRMDYGETKDEMLERLLAEEKPKCPHCNEPMQLWEVPHIAMGDGLGWGSPFLYICFNDGCPLYVGGWDSIESNYAHKASHRCMNYPGTETFECLPVFSPEGGGGQVMDNDVAAKQAAEREALKRGFQILADSYVTKNLVNMMTLLVDAGEPTRVRIKAAEMIGDVAEDTECIEPMRSHRFGNRLLKEAVDTAVEKIHDRCFTRECPFCAEIVKKRAKVCKHCGKEIAGQ
ncbi:MAG: zinc ribbon domain-containing protein [Deltaproteobacteria bacterium]|nr:MAG: zinc ribbon domain-containing protein [Deltaproteobacteria bacterium]